MAVVTVTPFQVDLAHMLAARDQELRTLSAEVCLTYVLLVCFDWIFNNIQLMCISVNVTRCWSLLILVNIVGKPPQWCEFMFSIFFCFGFTVWICFYTLRYLVRLFFFFQQGNQAFIVKNEKTIQVHKKKPSQQKGIP